MLRGPDVSSYQKSVDWRAVAASGRDFAWCKSTEGTGYVNPYFEGNWRGMADAGLVRGAYHYGRPDLGLPENEAEKFLNVVGPLRPGDLLALDLEQQANTDLLAWALGFLRTTTQLAGLKPMLYSGRWYLDPNGVEASAELGTYGLWLSGYQANPPQLPPGWETLAMWQDTDQASIPGVGGPVDESVFFGSRDQLLLYGYRPPMAPAYTVASQVVTCLSVIGDNTYPDGCDMDALAEGQPVSRRVFIRQLVQYIKTLPGLPADLITMVSVIGDNTYPDGSSMDALAAGQTVSKRVFVRELVQRAKALLGA